MKPHVVKFFQFLEAKEDKRLPLKTKLLSSDKFKFTKEELDVDGNLFLSNTDITTLPDGLKVGGSLDLTGCTSLKELPNGLRVDRSLYLDDTPLAKMYNEDEIRAMIEAKGGYVGVHIYSYSYNK